MKRVAACAGKPAGSKKNNAANEVSGRYFCFLQSVFHYNILSPTDNPITMQTLVFWIFRLVSILPLPVLHRMGWVLGSLGFYAMPANRRRIRTHLKTAGIIADNALVKTVLRETARGGLELPLAWMRSSEHIVSLFQEIHGWEYIQAALDNKQGLLLVTPHLGSYDLAGRYISHHLPFPLTALYRPPKLAWLEVVMNAGRVRDKGRTAPTNLYGVKQVMKALKNGEATIVLPDQVPGAGDGVWVRFFDQPAYTMTLAARLANMPRVATLFFCGVRLAHGRGFALHIAPLSGSLSGDKTQDTQLINDNVEHWVSRFPTQYLFGYNRFKGAPPANMT